MSIRFFFFNFTLFKRRNGLGGENAMAQSCSKGPIHFRRELHEFIMHITVRRVLKLLINNEFQNKKTTRNTVKRYKLQRFKLRRL